MKHLLRLGLLALLLMPALPASAAIYSYIDEAGNRVFTDRPGNHATEPVETKPSNRMPAPPLPELAPLPTKTLKAPTLGYALLDLVQPASDATIRNNAGELSVTATSDPGLHPGHRYRLLLDGTATGESTEQPAFLLENVDRGTHQLTLEVVDAQGEPVQSSLPRTFHMMRTSLAQRRMARPCKQADYGVRPECPLKDKPKEKRDIPFVPFL